MSLRNEAYNSIKKKMRRLIVMDKISIIIPCFNEEEALPIYYAEMKKVKSEKPFLNFIHR